MTLTISILIFMSFYCIVSGQIKGKLALKLFLECILAFSNTFFIFKGIIMQTYHAYYHMKLKRLCYVHNPRSLSVGHYELSRDDIRGLLSLT